jgi:hypothetical protein
MSGKFWLLVHHSFLLCIVVLWLSAHIVGAAAIPQLFSIQH